MSHDRQPALLGSMNSTAAMRLVLVRFACIVAECSVCVYYPVCWMWPPVSNGWLRHGQQVPPLWSWLVSVHADDGFAAPLAAS